MTQMAAPVSPICSKTARNRELFDIPVQDVRTREPTFSSTVSVDVYLSLQHPSKVGYSCNGLYEVHHDPVEKPEEFITSANVG